MCALYSLCSLYRCWVVGWGTKVHHMPSSPCMHTRQKLISYLWAQRLCHTSQIVHKYFEYLLYALTKFSYQSELLPLRWRDSPEVHRYFKVWRPSTVHTLLLGQGTNKETLISCPTNDLAAWKNAIILPEAGAFKQYNVAVIAGSEMMKTRRNWLFPSKLVVFHGTVAPAYASRSKLLFYPITERRALRSKNMERFPIVSMYALKYHVFTRTLFLANPVVSSTYNFKPCRVRLHKISTQGLAGYQLCQRRNFYVSSCNHRHTIRHNVNITSK